MYHELRKRGTGPHAARPAFAMAVLVAAIAFLLFGADATQAQTAFSGEDARAIEFGKEIFKVKANCQFCHKWDASGDTGYGGHALSLRKTALTQEQFAEVVRCGRPSTGMPFHDRLAYTDKRCFDVTREEVGKDLPPMGEFLSAREIDAVVRYLFAKAVGRGASTYEECVDFWGKETRQCEPMKK
jgi:mono/diheme cytochrome c family protein